MLLLLRNVQDLLADGKTLSEGRFGEPFKGPIIPFGAFVEYHPISMRDQSRLHQLGKKVLPNIFLITYPRRINAQQVFITQMREEIIFPIADGTAKLSI